MGETVAPSDLAALRVELAAFIDDRLGDKSREPGSPQRPAAPQRFDEPAAEAVAATGSASQTTPARRRALHTHGS